jgi:hypothetical protein
LKIVTKNIFSNLVTTRPITKVPFPAVTFCPPDDGKWMVIVKAIEKLTTVEQIFKLVKIECPFFKKFMEFFVSTKNGFEFFEKIEKCCIITKLYYLYKYIFKVTIAMICCFFGLFSSFETQNHCLK